MDSPTSSIDDEYIDDELSTSKALEIAYEEILRSTDMIIKDEGARRLRLRILLLENENDDLHDQLALGDDRIDVLEQECNRLRDDSIQSQEETSRLESELRIQSRELSNLRAELNSMNGITTDSTKLLTEKLSLSRELAILKPEIDHLRTQASHQQTVLAEKLALERQVVTLEVELETEKRAARRIAENHSRNQKEVELQNLVEKLERDLVKEKLEKEKTRKEVEAELQTQIEGLQVDLAREKREKRKAQKDSEDKLHVQVEDLQAALAREKMDCEKLCKKTDRDLKTAEARGTVLESKIEQLKSKLTSTKDLLKASQEELKQARSALARSSGPGSLKDALGKNPLKRSAQEINHDAVIGTPDGGGVRGKRPGAKRGIIDQTSLGEKSMFSITPYLNRTANLAPDTPVTDEKPEEIALSPESQKFNSVPSTLVVSGAVKPKERKKATGKSSIAAKEVIADVENTKTNRKTKMPPTRLEKVNEEEIDESVATKGAPITGNEIVSMTKLSELKLKVANVDEIEPKKKKRKLLGVGKTLFDEEDGETARRTARIGIGTVRLIGNTSAGGGLKNAGSAGFGTFSPLKKDRRGVGSSFLS